jgi:hypothetical protein
LSKHALTRNPAIALLGLSLIVFGIRGVHAASPPVSVGEVTIAHDCVVAEATPQLRRSLRAALTEELTELHRRGVVPSYPLVVSATLSELSSERRERHASATAVISLALRRTDDHVLFAELRGRASAEEAAGTLASVRSAALRAAVRGAAKRLPEAVRRPR